MNRFKSIKKFFIKQELIYINILFIIRCLIKSFFCSFHHKHKPMRIHQKAMREIDDGAHLKDLKTFRWELYHFRNSKEVIRCLSRYYFKKYAFKYFGEEIVIAGYNLQDVRRKLFFRHHNLPSN